MHNEESVPPNEAIRTRAYLLWEADGRQHGRDVHYWREAIAQLEGESISRVASLPAAKRQSEKLKKAPKSKKVVSSDAQVESEAVGDANGVKVVEPKPKRIRKSAPASDTKLVNAEKRRAKDFTAEKPTAGTSGTKKIATKAETSKPAAKRSKKSIQGRG